MCDAIKLRDILVGHFDENELRDLCFELKVDYESLPGTGKSARARELVAFMERRGRLPELEEACYRLRPDACNGNKITNGTPSSLPQFWHLFVIIGVLLAIIGTGGFFFFNGMGMPEETTLTVRVATQAGQPIPRASVQLLSGGEIPIRQTSDSNGIVIFTTDASLQEARLVTDAPGYQIDETNVNLSTQQDITINLRSTDAAMHSVTIKVVDKTNLQPMNNAEIILIAQGQTFVDYTDDSGLAQFHIEFPGDTLQVDLRVISADNEISHKNITLHPDTLQEIRLDPVAESLDIISPETP
jgi:hypothetical protein